MIQNAPSNYKDLLLPLHWNDDDLCSVKLWSVTLFRLFLLLSCLLVMVSDLKLKSYNIIEGCKIIYSVIDNSKFETDVRLIIPCTLKDTY
jgi:hypothetical protein